MGFEQARSICSLAHFSVLKPILSPGSATYELPTPDLSSLQPITWEPMAMRLLTLTKGGATDTTPKGLYKPINKRLYFRGTFLNMMRN